MKKVVASAERSEPVIEKVKTTGQLQAEADVAALAAPAPARELQSDAAAEQQPASGTTISGTGLGGSVGPTGTITGTNCTRLAVSDLLSVLGTGPVFLAAAPATAASPAGRIYFTAYNSNLVGFYDPSSSTYVLPGSSLLPASSGPAGIALGPDGQFWIAEYGANRIDEVEYDDATSTFALSGQNALPTGASALSGPINTALGPDGNMWFTDYTTAGIQSIAAEAVFGASIPASASTNTPTGIVLGPDDALWFAETGVDMIARLDPVALTIKEYPVSSCSSPTSLTVGSDGNLWFTEPGATKIGKIAPDGSGYTEYPSSGTLQGIPMGITSGPDCNVWFTEAGSDLVGNVAVSGGAIDESRTLTGGVDPVGIALGADGNLYVAESNGGSAASSGGAIAQVTVTGTNACSSPVFPAVADCVSGPVTLQATGCSAAAAPAQFDAGSTDPNSMTSPAAAPSEVVIPTSLPAGASTTVTLLAAPAARPSGAPGTNPAAPRPESACHIPAVAKPQITCAPNQTLECSGNLGVTLASPLASAPTCAGIGSVTCTPGSTTFGLGMTQVSCSVKAAATGVGNSCNTSVTVQDTKPPVISSAVANPPALAPDGKTDQVTVTVSDTDACDPTPACKIVSVTGGTASPTNGLTASLVAQPVGLFPRTITLAIQCADEANNTAKGSVQVTVRSPIAQAVINLINLVEKII